MEKSVEIGVRPLAPRVRAAIATLLLFCLALVWAPASYAQNDTSRLQGTVADATGAVIPNVTVTVSNKANGFKAEANTSTEGTFTLSALPVGDYTITAKLTGFKTYNQDVRIDAGIFATANISLVPGEVTDSVTVTENAGLVQSTTSNIATTVQGQQITDLPLNGRNFTELATLVPGVTRGAPGGIQTGTQGNAETFRFGDSGGSALVVNGLRPQANNFILDGADNNESLVNAIVFFPPAEAIQEFTVQTSISPAEFGRAGGAIVNTVIKSGTNEIHGSAFWFLRNSQLDARPTFDPTRPEFRRHQFGGTLGFPILKNKLFVFGDYQGLRQFTPVSVDHASVPTALMRMGNFSELLNPAVSGLSIPIVIHNVLTGQPFPNNVIPSNLLNKAGLAYLNAYPMPNLPGVEQNFIIARSQTQNFDDFDTRVDYVFSDRDLVFGRFSYGDDSSVTSTRLPPNLPAGFGSGSNFNQPRGFVLGETHTFSATVINEFRAAWQREYFGYNPPFGNVAVSAMLGIPNANTSPLLGGGALIGGYNGELEYTGDYGLYAVPQNTYQLADSVTWSKGNHTVKSGFNVIYRQVNLFRPIAGKGYFFLCGNGGNPALGGAGDGCAAGSTGYETADILAGFVDNYQIGAQTGYFGTRSWEDGVFVQDDWRVTRRFSLNVGLRYDILTWPSEQFGRQTNFDLATGQLITPQSASSIGVGAALVNNNNASSLGVGPALVKNNYLNFTPRLGFAWDATGKGSTIVRGGYGIFYFIDRGGISNQLAQNQPYSGNQQFNYTNGYRITLTGQGALNNNDPTAATGPLPPAGVPANFSYTNPQNISVVAALFNNRTPQVMEYNMQIQQQLPGNSVFQIAYVGTQGRHLTTYFNQNQILFNTAGLKIYPNLGSVTVQANIGDSSYNSLQAQFERRLKNGFEFRASYTFSKSIDDSPGAFDAALPQDTFARFLERAVSDFNQKQVFVASSLYQLPFGKGKKYGSGWSRPVDVVLGGWQLNGIFTASSGLPFSVFSGSPERANLIAPVQILGNTGEYFTTSSFAAPAQNSSGVYIAPGTAGRNILRGPRIIDGDISVFKDFTLYERIKLQFRSEFYNIANHPRFNNPDSNLGDGNFGVINSTVQASERQIEFALRLTF